MPRVPDAECAGGCGKMLVGSPTSRPPGMRMCRDCMVRINAERRAQRVCSRPDCTHLVRARGLCKNHYNRTVGKPCATAGCERPSHAGSLCRAHYRKEARANGRVVSPSEAWTEARRNTYHARRARMKGARNGDKVLVSALLVRDGDACSSCGERIDGDVKWPDAMSLSIDHTRPVSRGGEHSMSNTTLMHLRCNMIKADRVLD